MASTISRIWQHVTEGLIFGFTFAIGWIAAIALMGAFAA